MPRTPSLRTLKSTCLLNIAHNMDNYWCADYVKNFMDQGNFLYVIGPFEYLPPPLIGALLEMLSERNKLKKHHLHLLIDQTINQLDMSLLKPAANTNAIVRMVINRCKKLTHLNMAGCDQVSAKVLCELATSLPHLTHLDLRGTQFSDQGCAILGHYCFKLKELNLSRCPVSDNGMTSLCATFGDRKKCPNLRKLDISSTMVGLKGVKEVLINLPYLQWFVHPLAFMGLGFLLYDDFVVGQIVPLEKQYKLRNTFIEHFHVGHGQMVPGFDSNFHLNEDLEERFVMTSFAYCPLIVEINIDFRMTPKLWKALSSLEHLQHIHIADEASSDFDSCVVPVLQKNGENVHHLNLSNINNIDIDVIGATCPKIKELMLSLSGSTDYGFVQNSRPDILRTASPHMFSTLTDLHLTFYEQFFLGDFGIARLLGKCLMLTNLIMINVQSFTDGVLEDVLSVNPLEKLQTFCLISCDNIAGGTVARLLYMNNDLWSLTLKGCAQITRRETDEMKKFVKARKLDVNILWD